MAVRASDAGQERSAPGRRPDSATRDLPSSVHSLAQRYPRTIAAFAAMDAFDHLGRILALDAAWDAIRQGRQPTGNDRSPSDAYLVAPVQGAIAYDLIYAGGGLGLLHAAVMAQRYGYRVLLFDRGTVGCAHREWNISRTELAALVAIGLCTWDELSDVIMARYERGVVRFYAGARRPSTELWLQDVLDVALDAGALLRLARRKLEAAGGVVLDQRAFRRVIVSDRDPMRVLVEVVGADGTLERYGGRLLIDGMGSSSPLALQRFAGRPFAGVCPTVGTVATGFVAGDAPDTFNPRVGEILISLADARRGQQYLWEGFPGRGDELTVYLFYYDTLAPAGPRSPSLLELFEDYFALLPTYKRPGPGFRHIKPVYGYIPARHSLRRQEAPLLRGVLPLGDAAAQQSPLTFCGFGSHVRNLGRTTSLLHAALRQGLTSPRHLGLISPYQANVALNWVFSRFMQPWSAPDDVNRLQNVFLSTLNALGEDLARRFFRDQMRWGDYHRVILGVFWRYPQIVSIAWRVLGPAGIRRWIADYLVYSAAALAAWCGQKIGVRGRDGLAAWVERRAPALGLRLRARFAEWQVMGWV